MKPVLLVILASEQSVFKVSVLAAGRMALCKDTGDFNKGQILKKLKTMNPKYARNRFKVC